MNATLVGVLFATVCLGLLLFFAGKRGRKLSNHPQCRDCGFDLEGVYPATITCPECGSGLRRPGAVRNGVRRRMGWLMALGVLVVLMPLAPLVTMVYASVTGTNLAKYTPTGLLLWQTRVSSPVVNKQIADELIDRLIKNQLDKAQSAAVAERALAIQGDQAVEWNEVWGDVIERLNLNGSLDKTHLDRFRRQSIVLTGSCRAAVRPGDSLPVAVKQGPSRTGVSSQMMALATVSSAKLGDVNLRRTGGGSAGLFGSGFLGSSAGPAQMYFYIYGSKMNNGWMGPGMSDQVVSLTVPKAVEPGVHTLTMTVLCRVQEQQGGAGWNMAKMKADDPGVSSFTITQRVTVLPAEADPIKRTTPTPAQEKELRALLRSATLTSNIGVSGASLPFFGGVSVDRTVVMQLEIPTSAPPFAFEVFVKVGEKETALGAVASKQSAMSSNAGFYMGGTPGGGQHVYLTGEVTNLRKADKTVDLIFKPSNRTALNTIDLAEIYGSEIVLKNVTLNRNDYRPTAEPAEPVEESEPDDK